MHYPITCESFVAVRATHSVLSNDFPIRLESRDRRESVPLYLGVLAIQRVAFQIEVKWAQYSYSRGYLT